jgi:alkylation response protein AidB-like acyl-CoA dehydrogenase
MNFDFSDDQKMLKEQARKFLSEKCTPKVVRKILEGDEPYDKALWKQIAEMGWLGTAVPEEFGGLGLGHLELCVIAEELGRVVAPVPFASSVYLATEALLLAGTDAQKKKYLPKRTATGTENHCDDVQGRQARRREGAGAGWRLRRFRHCPREVGRRAGRAFAVTGHC